MDVTQTVVIAQLGDVPGGGSAQVVIRTLVASDTVAGTAPGLTAGTGPGLAARTGPGLAARAGYTNTATYSAVNLDPGASNEARVVIEGAVVLPVTGGLLDPRTPQGKAAWGGMGALALISGTVVVYRRRSMKKRMGHL